MRYSLRALVVLCLSLAAAVAGLPAPTPAAADAGAGTPVRSTVVHGLVASGDARLSDAATGIVSRPLALPFRASMLALALPHDARAELRVTPPDGAPGPWLQAPSHGGDEGPDAGSEEAARSAEVTGGLAVTDPVWVSDASAVEVRVSGADLPAVAVHAIDSMGLSRGVADRALNALRAAWSPGHGAAPAVAATDRPAIVERADWEADESIVRAEPSLGATVRNAFLHHTVNGNDYSPAEAAGVVRGIQRYHVEGRGWDDIGYNFLVDRFGTVYEGRAGGIEEAVRGAQAGGFNDESTGVAVIGDLSTTSASKATVEALTRLFAWKLDLHHADVLGSVEVESAGSSRYPQGEVVELDRLSGHRDVSTTTCPASIYADLDDMRDAVAEEQGPVLVDASAPTTEVRVAGGRNLDEAVEFGARLRPADDWTVTVRDESGEDVLEESGEGAEAEAVVDVTDLARGTYTWEIAAADGRRPVTGQVELVAPEITDLDVPDELVADPDGELADPLAASAVLWEDASWSMSLADPSGDVVVADEGVGEKAELRWDGPAAEGGVYTFTLVADDLEPVETDVLVTRRGLQRVADDPDPVTASVDISRAAFDEPGTAEHAVVARADVFADALAAGPLAGTDGPVLLSGSRALDADVEEELDRVLAPSAPVYVLGGTEALGPGVVDALAPHPVIRLAGSERSATAVAIAEEVLERGGGRRVLLARASPDEQKPWADALAGGAWGATTATPVLLTASDRLSEPTAEFLEREGIEATLVLGGGQAIDDSVLEAVPGGRRIAGTDRAATAVAVARELWGRTAAGNGDAFVLADDYGSDAWTYALAASPLAARRTAPLVVGSSDGLPEATKEYLADLDYGQDHHATAVVVGPTEAVSAAAATEAEALLR